MAGRGYSIAGKKPLAATAHARGEIMVLCLAETSGDLRALAKMSARDGADAGESLLAEAEAYEHALAFARARMGLEDAPPRPATPAGPIAHTCSYPGCNAPAPNGFGLPGEPDLWACRAHAEEIRARYVADKAERERLQAEKLKPTTNLAGLGGRMI